MVITLTPVNGNKSEMLKTRLYMTYRFEMFKGRGCGFIELLTDTSGFIK